MINGANAQADAPRYIAEGMHANHYSVRMTRTAPGTDAGISAGRPTNNGGLRNVP